MRLISNEELSGISGGQVVERTAPIAPADLTAPEGMTIPTDLLGPMFIFLYDAPTTPAINPITGRQMCPDGYEPTDMKFTDNAGTSTANISYKDGKFSADLGGKTGEGTSTYSCKKP